MQQDIKAFFKAHEEEIKRDVKRIVDIKSVQGAPAPGAPFGEDVRRAQLEAMQMCREAGLEVVDVDGMVGYAHYGDADKYIGILSHLDVVPEGDDWSSPPYDVQERDGFLIGRGVMDDKGPFVISLWVVKYFMETKTPLRYGIRLIFGTNEESGMADMVYYHEKYGSPAFAFTPDSEFPVCHGEMGRYTADIVSPALGEGVLRSLAGGVAPNVVADRALAALGEEHYDALEKSAAGRDDIKLERKDGEIKVTAFGVSGHAGDPYKAVDANRKLLVFLLESGVLTEPERAAAQFVADITNGYDGDALGIACSDGKFPKLKIIGGMLALRDGRLVLNVDSRYPTAISPEEIESRIAERAAQTGFSVDLIDNKKPFYIEPDSPAIKTLVDTYNELSGDDEQPYLMAGGTYARIFDNAVAFGMEYPNTVHPGWVGYAHMKDEAMNVAEALLSAEIFATAIERLQNVEL